MTDTTNVFVLTSSEEDAGSVLAVRCKSGHTDITVVTSQKLAADGADGVAMEWRFDSASPESGTGETLVGEEGAILPTDDALSFINRIEKAKRFTVQIYGSDEITLTFDVAGLADAIQPYKWACNWKDLG